MSAACSNDGQNGLIHALDFWMRYPDYLVEELITRYEATKNQTDLGYILTALQPIYWLGIDRTSETSATVKQIRIYPVSLVKYSLNSPLPRSM